MKLYFRRMVTCILLIGLFLTGCSSSNLMNSTKKPVIGVVVAVLDDTWRTSVRNKLYEMGQENAEVDIWSANNSQEVQNQKVDALISKKINVLVVNLVEKSGAAGIIQKAKKANIPVIFFNIEPSAEDLKLWDKVYYVGAKGEESGIMQGKILASYFKTHPTRDGIIHYVMLKGPEEHQDAVARSKYSIKALEDEGFKVEKVSEDIAEWKREKAQEKMRNILGLYNDKIDCVIANNDDMALGAIDALKEKGYFQNGKYMPVVGVDATSSALSALKEGMLLGTVLNDAQSQGKAIFSISTALAKGKALSKDAATITDNKYIWIPYKMITKENIDDIK